MVNFLTHVCKGFENIKNCYNNIKSDTSSKLNYHHCITFFPVEELEILERIFKNFTAKWHDFIINKIINFLSLLYSNN